MNVIKIVPGHEPVMADINNTLADLQQAVGGYIETVTLPRTAWWSSSTRKAGCWICRKTVF